MTESTNVRVVHAGARKRAGGALHRVLHHVLHHVKRGLGRTLSAGAAGLAVAAALLGLTGQAQAGTLGTPALSPASINAGSATAVTFSISITDPNYLAGSANVQRLKPDGTALAVVGNLRDDGLLGDAVAGDKIYTLRLNVLEAAAGSINYRISAAFRGEIKRSFAGPIALSVNPAGPAPVIDAASLSPASTSAGVALLVTATATITDARLIAGSVVLQKLAPDASVLGTAGSLHDDGLDGDAVAGDKIYSLRSTVLQDTPGNVNYRVAAQFQGYGQPVLSANLPVAITGTATGINIAAPANGAYLNTPVLTISGRVGDAAAQVSINGITTPVTNNAFAAAVPLNEGPNTITAVATNSNGTTSTNSILITLDTTAPRVQIYTPGAGGNTSAANVTVTGLINDIVVGTVNPQQATVTVNGISANVVNRSFQANDVPLNIGSNTVQAVATDRAGNRATTSIQVTRVAAGQASLGLVSGNNQSAPVGSNLGEPLVARLVDAQGLPRAGQPIVFRVIGQDGNLSPTSGSANGLSAVAINTDAQGQARAWLRLGSRAGAGNNLVEASATGVATTADFAASATPGAANLMVVDSGNNQTGVVGQSLPLPFIAIVTDANNNRLAGVPVTFEVRAGNGSFSAGATTLQTTSDSDGRVATTLILGPDQGVNNNVVEALLPGSSAFPAAFAATGLIPGPADQTRISGVVLDNSNNPIPGVSMRLLNIHQGNFSNIPQQVAPEVRTDAQGQFVMTQVPVGVFKLMADGGTATRAGSWPTLDFDMITVPGQNNTLGMPVYLPELNPNNRVCVNETTGGTLTIAEAPGFALNIAPGSATFPGGSKTGCVSVTPVNMDKVPMSPGFGQQPRFIVTIQPVGTVFNPPARMSIPNVDGLAPRAVTEMYSYDHDLASFVAIGSATVSEDGSTITSDGGSGVIKAGWHCGGNPNATGSAGTCPTCRKCQGSTCVVDAAQSGATCNDKDVCTADDKCSGGNCRGTPISVRMTASSETICVGNAKQFVAETTPAGRPLTWSSSSGAATAGGGTVTGVAVGSATITATDNECARAKDSKTVRIMDKVSSADGPGEFQTCLTRPFACLTANSLRNEIDPATDPGTPTWVSTNFKSNNKPGECRANREGSEMDAATHSYLSCRLYRALGAGDAKAILDGHENEHPEDECISHEMDYNNNEVGRNLASQAGDCTDLVFRKLNGGGLQLNRPFPAGMCSWKGNGLP